jgi:hypothetical protein
MLGRARVVTLAALALTAAACRMPMADDGRIATGTWGGDHIRLDVASSGATTEYDCAHGTIDEPIVVDNNGRFSVSGTHTAEHGGPVRNDDPQDRHPARYDGRVVGDTMELTVTVADTGQRVGQFMLFLNHSARLVKCL